MALYGRVRRSHVGALILGVAFAGCSGLHQATPQAVLPQPGAGSLVAGKAVQHLYVGDDNKFGRLRIYKLPLTDSSVPEQQKKLDAPFLLAVDSDYVAVVTLADVIKIFKNPVTSKPPIASIKASSDGAPLFRPDGKLYKAADATIEIYSPPFTSHSQPSGSIPLTGIQADQMTQSPNGTVYIDGDSNMIGVVRNHSLIRIVTGPSGVQYRGLAATANKLFVCGFSNSPSANFVDVYTLPLKANSQPKFRVTKGQTATEACAADASGNLYVGQTNGAIDVYKTPISGNSKPAVVVKSGADIYGLAIGP